MTDPRSTSPLTETTTTRHQRERSNSLPSHITSNMVNPFLVEADDRVEPVEDTSERPASPYPGDATPIWEENTSAKPIIGNDFARPPADPYTTPTQGDDQFLAERLKDLGLELFHIRKEREEARSPASFFNNEADRLWETRDCTFTSNSTYTNEHPRIKIKPSDLPKFYGKDNEDVDEWIERFQPSSLIRQRQRPPSNSAPCASWHCLRMVYHSSGSGESSTHKLGRMEDRSSKWLLSARPRDDKTDVVPEPNSEAERILRRIFPVTKGSSEIRLSRRDLG